ncbi:1-acyl-sn-glycerol-3-phosphate acyltransferase [Thermodesulforhabdus norvegica]|uniref:Glycerol-3-phosphate acyltransferase n=1 Tax=Thermodesulforhabdus norvegica TaxID=39841 RepID=A0A1I4S4L5_9BACT|nr:1-acyl-sn-glycerol-3-phosphate acyltransferase [Thermodesulforhabdus norvegica]SFM59437.1 glycerol-3-phosphate acyltransferase [Thermodesulforhabdus norvegica]
MNKIPAKDVTEETKDLEGHNKYGCTIPERPFYPLRFILERLIRLGKMPPDQQKVLEELSKQGVIVYALRFQSLFDLLYIKTRLFQMGLPHPEFVFDMRPYRLRPFVDAWSLRIAHLTHYLKHSALPNPYEDGHYKKLIEEGKTGALFLLTTETQSRRAIAFGEDPLQHLIEIQSSTEKPIYIVPCAVVYSRHPGRESFNDKSSWFTQKNPGILRKTFSFLRGYRHAVIEIGDPVNLKDVLTELSPISSERRTQIFQLRRNLLDSVNSIYKSILGPALKSKLELKEIILNNPKLQTYMRRKAKSTGRKIWDIYREADKYLEEIAADYSYSLIKIMERALRWAWNTIFDGIEIDEEGLRKVKKAAQRHTLVYIPCHKSHIDYLILSYVLFQANLSPPFIAAGKNLSFWPLGPIFRRGGAFFIRRTFRGQRFYAEVFSLYVKTMVHLGHNIEFFIEGGRSRTGKLILPKLGLLSILIQAVEEGYCSDLVFVPTAICYDRIPEEESYVHEITGGSKQAENIKQLFGLRRFLKRKYGRVYVRFAKPISLAQYLERNKLNLKKMRPRERHEVYRDFAFRIINSINNVSVVTPHALVSSSLLTTSRSGISLITLKLTMRTMLEYLSFINVKFSRTFNNYDSMLEETLTDLEKSKVIERIREPEDSEEDILISIEEKKRHILEYYKNNIIHFFLPLSFVSASIIAQKTFRPKLEHILEDYRFLKKLFKHEFAYDNDIPDEKNIENACDFLLRQNWIVNLGSEGEFELKHEGLRACEIFASIIQNYLEGYWICLRGLRFLEKKEKYQDREFVKKILAEGRKALKLGFIERPESISKIMYENALKLFEEEDYLGKSVEREGKEKTEPKEFFVKGPRYDEISAMLRKVGRFLRRDG